MCNRHLSLKWIPRVGPCLFVSHILWCYMYCRVGTSLIGSLRKQLLLTTGDVTLGGMSAPQRQQFLTDDVKICPESGQEHWLGDLVEMLCELLVYEWDTKDKRPQRSNINAITKQSVFVEYILLKIKIVSFTAGARSQKNTKPYQNLLNPMTTGLVK